MSPNRQVLLVTAAGGDTTALAPDLLAAGYEVRVVSDFATAKTLLGTGPEVLITELKLGAFNGLHLAIRAGAQGTPTIIIGETDPVLEAEAKRQHARYITSPPDHQAVLTTIRELLSAPTHTRRSARKPVPLLDALVNELPARVLDVSYEGLRLEARDGPPDALPPQFTVTLPMFNFSCAVQRVWVAPLTVDADGTPRGIACGAALATDDVTAAMAWRTLVDAMPGLAFRA